MKTSRFKKTLALLLAVVMCVSTFCMTASAAENSPTVGTAQCDSMSVEMTTAVSPRSIIFSKSGYLSNEHKSYDFTIPSSGWYHWTASAGDCNIWFNMTGLNISGSYTGKDVASGTSVTYNVYFQAGTNTVTVTSAPYDGSFSIIISSGKV